MKKTMVVLGAGNGCGNRVAEKFGTNDFRVILMSRSKEHTHSKNTDTTDRLTCGVCVFSYRLADLSHSCPMRRCDFCSELFLYSGFNYINICPCSEPPSTLRLWWP